MRKMNASAFLMSSLLAFNVGCGKSGWAQEIETPPAPPGVAKAEPYLSSVALDYRSILGAPPAVGSIRDKIDYDAVSKSQVSASVSRWETARRDESYLYVRFSEPLGRQIDRTNMPLTVHLLNRVLRDVAGPVFAAKKNFQRPRPYQRFQLTRLCGEGSAPPPESNPASGSSYPSGHSAYGWVTALVLAQVAPERGPALLERAADYAQSRLVCGMHFPSDVEAGHVIATAVAERLASSAAFEQDLVCAKAEYASISRGGVVLTNCASTN